MINSINKSPSFGGDVAIIMPKNLSNSYLYDKLNVRNAYNYKFVEAFIAKGKVLGDEFTVTAKYDVKNPKLKGFVLSDAKVNSGKLTAFISSLFSDCKSQFKVIQLK